MSALTPDLPIRAYNQTNDPLPDGQLDPEWQYDCGEESLSEIGQAFGFGGDVGYTAGEIRRIIRHGDIKGSGLTSGDDLVYGLSACFKIPAHVRNANVASLTVEIGHCYATRLPAILLGMWDGAPHWVTMINVDDQQGIKVNDSWNPSGPQQGIVKWVPWSQVADAAHGYLGTYVHVDAALP